MICLSGLRGTAACLSISQFALICASFNLFTLRDVHAEELEYFQSSFMRQTSEAGHIALDALSKGQDVVPGRYWVAIQVNSRLIDQQHLDFSLAIDNETLVPCLPASLLTLSGVKLDALKDPSSLQTNCLDLAILVPGSTVDFDSSKMLIDISIPQIALRADVVGYVDPKRWDSGINAAYMNYQASAQRGRNRYNGPTESEDLLLNMGVNYEGWRFRSTQALRQGESDKRNWVRSSTFLQRDIPGTLANITVGETSTDGDVFRSIPVQGVLIRSDAGMLPDVLQGYAPIIRGVAQTRAKLEVRQNGYPIYSTYVSAGPYEINDLTTAGSSAELEIVLTEEDGQVRRFTQPFSTLSNLLREGVWRYSVFAGRYNAVYDMSAPLLWQSTLTVGTGWDTTLYGGLMGSDFYQAGSLGLAKDLGAIGALAFDVTRSNVQINTINDQSLRGMSYAIKYGKSFKTGTDLRFAGYRYSTQGYRDFDEALRERSQSSDFLGSRRSQIVASLYQNLTNSSSVNLSLSHQDYWGTDYNQRQFQFSFNTQHKGITYSLMASQALSDTYNNDRQISLSVSIPLDFALASNATFDVQKNGDHFSKRSSISGKIHNQKLSYRASLSQTESQQTSTSFSTNYQTPFASLGGGVTYGTDYRSLAINTSGAVLLHDQGIEFSPYLGETVALIQVPEIAGVGVVNATGALTNKEGFAIAPYMRPYRINHLELQTDDLDPTIEIENGTAQVVPRRGAIVKHVFTARKINRLLLTGSMPNGQPLPFAAQVSTADGEQLGVIGQAGQILLSTDLTPQTLTVRWGVLSDQHCELKIEPEAMQNLDGFYTQDLVCR